MSATCSHRWTQMISWIPVRNFLRQSYEVPRAPRPLFSFDQPTGATRDTEGEQKEQTAGMREPQASTAIQQRQAASFPQLKFEK